MDEPTDVADFFCRNCQHEIFLFSFLLFYISSFHHKKAAPRVKPV